MLCCSASAWTKTRVCTSLRRAADRCRRISSRASRLSYTVRPDASPKRTAEPSPRSRDWRSRQPRMAHARARRCRTRAVHRKHSSAVSVYNALARLTPVATRARGADGPVARPGGTWARDTGHRRWGAIDGVVRQRPRLRVTAKRTQTQRKRIVTALACAVHRSHIM